MTDGVRAVIALGANLGDREATVEGAVAALDALPLTRVERASKAYETIAVTEDGEDDSAPRYLNAVVLVRTRLAPSILLDALHGIEARHGRERHKRWGDRTLDLDLIAYGRVRSADPGLTLPHPRAAERAFVLAPWHEIEPDAEVPGRGAIADLLHELRSGS